MYPISRLMVGIHDEHLACHEHAETVPRRSETLRWAANAVTLRPPGHVGIAEFADIFASGKKARTAGLDEMSVSRGLRGLLKASRAQRVEDPEGAHRWLWQLTPKGWALYDAILPMAQRRERDAVSGLGAAATKALKTGLQSVVTRLTDKPNLAANRHRQR